MPNSPLRHGFLTLFFLIYSCSPLFGASPQKLACLYNSLDPKSVAQHLAFYELYSDTPEGQRALNDACQLLSGSSDQTVAATHFQLSSTPIQAVIALVNKQPNESAPELSDNDLALIESLAYNLANRRLKGHKATTEAQVLALPTEEIDLSRALFIAQFGETFEGLQKVRSYDASIDLMALQIRARLSPTATPEEKIAAINQFIFYEMGFRFPPHSLYAKEIDHYTFLPSVLDSRRGVCLGVSILYLAIAQRLDLALEIVTPPGHIYVRYNKNGTCINIETTARGVHIDCDEYLSIDTLKLQKRDLKEVVGMAYFNQAGALISHNQFKEALSCYERAALYQPGDQQVQEFMGYCSILAGNEERGKRLLEPIADYIPDYAVTGNSMPIDLLNGKGDAEALEAVLMHVDESRESILTKQNKLYSATIRCPQFRAAHISLASAWMQLHRPDEALAALQRCHAIDPNDPTTEYYLAALYAERYDYPSAWKHLRQAEKITAEKQYSPKPLKELRLQLMLQR